jgi:integrase
MSIRKTKTGYLVEIRNRASGVRTRRSVKTKKEAVALEAQLRQDIERLATPSAGIEKALEDYLKGEAKTLTDYDGLLSKARAIRPYIKGKTFDQTGMIAAKIKRDMLQQGLKPATINRRLALLRRLANLAFDWGWIEVQEGRRVKLLPGEEERHYYLEIDQVDKLIELCPDTGHLIRLAVYTGMRRGELFKMYVDPGFPEFICLPVNTKTKQPRLIPLPEQVTAIVKSLDLPLDPAYDWLIRKEFEAAMEKLGLQHIRFHDLRHTYASLLAQAGASLQLIGKAMGHSSTQMTARYAHLVAENLRELADRLSAIGSKTGST